MGVGAVIYAVSGSAIKREDAVFKHSSYIPASKENSNNVAEYMGFKEILQWIRDNHNPALHSLTVQIWGDSKLVINQMTGDWRIKFGYYVPHANYCRELIKNLRERGLSLKLAWHPRELNAYADELSKSELIKHHIQFKIQPL